MRKLFLPLALVVALLLTVLTVGAFAATEEIGTAEELVALMNDSSKWAGDYVLTADIDLTGKTPALIGSSSSALFSGTFDGRGHTISGLTYNVTSGTPATYYGLFGYVKDATIENLTVAGSINVTPKAKAPGNVGGIVAYASDNCTFRNLTNKVNVFIWSQSDAGVAGVIGRINVKAGASCLVENCKNEGSVQSRTWTGGIVGVCSSSSSSNHGKVTIRGCWNTGAITTQYASPSSSNKYVGGIAALFRSYSATASDFVIEDCLNDGAIYAYATCAAGIAAQCNTAGTAQTFRRCLNRGSVTSGTAEFVNPVIGATLSASSLSDLYYNTTDAYSNEATSMVGNTYVADLTVASELEGLKSDAWIIVDGHEPELAAFHTEHVATTYTALDNDNHAEICYCGTAFNTAAHNFDGDTCTECGWVYQAEACQHENTSLVTDTPATCIATGVGHTVCDACGATTALGVVIGVDSANHASETVSFAYNADASAILYTRDCCGATVYADTTNGGDVYVGGANATTPTASMTAAVGTAALPFADFADAMNYAAALAKMNDTDVTVHLNGTVNVGASYHSPKTEYTITITGDVLNFNGSPRRFYAEGPITFEKLTFKSSANEVRIFAQNHKMVMGEGIVMGNNGTLASGTGFPEVNSFKGYVFGGFESAAIPTSGMNTDLTVRSGDWWGAFGWNVSGDSYLTNGTGKLTVGKTDPDDYLFIDFLIPYSTGAQQLNAASKVTVVVDGNVDARVFVPNTQNSIAANKGMLYETDLVLKGAMNSAARTGMGKVDITGATGLTNTVLNVYTDTSLESAMRDTTLFDEESDNYDASFTTLKTAITLKSYVNYCVDVLGGHIDADGNPIEEGTCARCGAELDSCEHLNMTEEVTLAPTCVAAGSKTVTCSDCGSFWTEEIAIDPDAHSYLGQTAVWNEETGKFELSCALSASHTKLETETLNIYVDAAATVDPETGDDTASGLTPETAVRTIGEAITRIGNYDGTVTLKDRYVVSATTTLPAHTGTVTFTSVRKVDANGNLGGASTGFVTGSHGVTLNLNGPTVFEYIIFNNEVVATKTSSGTYYKILVIAANWNDLTFGDGVATYGGSYVIMGNVGGSNEETKTVHLNVNRGTAFNSRVPDGATYKEGKVAFFERIYLFDRNATSTKNKTVIVNFNNNTATSVYTHSTSSEEKGMVDMQNNRLTINYTGGTSADIASMVTVPNTGGMTSYLDSMELNLGGNANIGSLFTYNVHDLTITVSGSTGGRTEKVAKFTLSKSNAYTPDGNETLAITYGSHSFATAFGDSWYNAMYRNGNQTVTAIDECTWDDGVFTMTDEGTAKLVYTCSKCGKTRVEDLTVEDNAPEEGYPTYKLIQTGMDEIALLSAVPSFEGYKNVGFTVTLGDKTQTFTTGTGYETITAGTAVEFTAANFGMEGGAVYGIRLTGLTEGQMQALGEIEVIPVNNIVD